MGGGREKKPQVEKDITKYGLKAKRRRTNNQSSKEKKADSVKKQKLESGVTRWLEKEEENNILREFDLNCQFGPCVGIGRLTRWKRAHSLGLQPPLTVLEILEKRSSEKDESLFEKYKSLI
ncbi:hypothetical protein Gasu2_13440 [Galdieria sulphuraria]|uniref:DNA polymerase delta subunit 4 n=1 Tax=Galdieria sulphuraria TaxID=130081 RepID=M2WY92_GALSU|nr:DNA polymerase delta subunit 4 [Galdieria sulphuraria]EME29020.1 DNA polymerase delta subunit 4 [Galdieria sulphuraria]GJD06958.1 hypothetical protein Gasu2_13440 [Galdieria sulphuraria]|eukprot:XP_005705540.1 DNA polymerase delta subunit 4 [Galdieria sulphuraria]